MKPLRMNPYRSRYKFFALTLLISLLIGVEDCLGLPWNDSIVAFSLVDKTFVSKKDLEIISNDSKEESNKRFNATLIAFLAFLLQLVDFVDRKVIAVKEKKQKKMNFFKNFLRRTKC